MFKKTTVQVRGHNVPAIIVEGAYADNLDKTVGVYLIPEDVLDDDAFAIIAWSNLSQEQKEIASYNCQKLTDWHNNPVNGTKTFDTAMVTLLQFVDLVPNKSFILDQMDCSDKDFENALQIVQKKYGYDSSNV